MSRARACSLLPGAPRSRAPRSAADGSAEIMELAQIRYFLAVCETRHFTRAAAKCGVSQPSLSAAIKRLERECGGALFERGPPVRLTARGRAVRRHFLAIRRQVDKVRRLMRRHGGARPADRPAGTRLLDPASRREVVLLA